MLKQKMVKLVSIWQEFVDTRVSHNCFLKRELILMFDPSTPWYVAHRYLIIWVLILFSTVLTILLIPALSSWKPFC